MTGIDRSVVGRMWSSTDRFAPGGRRGRGRPGRAQPDFDSAALFARGDTCEAANLVQGICVRARSATATALLPLGLPLRLVLSGDAKDPPDLWVKLSGDYSIASSSPCDVTHRKEA